MIKLILGFTRGSRLFKIQHQFYPAWSLSGLRTNEFFEVIG